MTSPAQTASCFANMWIQTDDSAYTDVNNPMMLAAMPGQWATARRRP